MDNEKKKQFCIIQRSANSTVVCSYIFLQHIWAIFIENTHAWERSAIEIYMK